jgi:2-methylcitrate dehydratase PrpD
MDGIEAFVDHVTGTEMSALPTSTIHAVKQFLLDTFGVGVAGSAGPWVAELMRAQARSLDGHQARAWVDGRNLSAAGAAMCNGYLIHNSEFDCVHERAVVHTMTVPVACAMAIAERERDVSGEDLIVALALGVDVACGLGIACRDGLRFFRPAVAGAMGAIATLGKLLGFDRDQMRSAFGIVHAQLGGTMQAHTEGSALLAMQIGFNARNVVMAADMAAAGLPGTTNVLEGDFGYFSLFEGSYDLREVLDDLGRSWRIEEVAYKPFPSGRATHGVIDGCLRLQREHGFHADAVRHVRACVPSLVNHLVGRPIHGAMSVNYARLCLPYAAASALLHDGLSVRDFTASALGESERLALGARVEVRVDDNPDPNALAPVVVAIGLEDGRVLETEVATVYGNPANPMSREAALRKLEDNWAFANPPLPLAKMHALIDAIDSLESNGDVGGLVDHLVEP